MVTFLVAQNVGLFQADLDWFLSEALGDGMYGFSYINNYNLVTF